MVVISSISYVLRLIIITECTSQNYVCEYVEKYILQVYNIYTDNLSGKGWNA